MHVVLVRIRASIDLPSKFGLPALEDSTIENDVCDARVTSHLMTKSGAVNAIDRVMGQIKSVAGIMVAFAGPMTRISQNAVARTVTPGPVPRRVGQCLSACFCFRCQLPAPPRENHHKNQQQHDKR